MPAPTGVAPSAVDEDGPSLAELAHRVDEAAAALESLAPEARERAEAVKAAIEAFHRPALVAIVQALKADPRGKELLFELVDDPAVLAVLSLHGIVRTPPPAGAKGASSPAPPSAPGPTTTFIPLSSLGRRAPARTERPDPAAGWVPGPARAEVPVGTMLRFDVVAGATAVPSSFLVTNVAGRPAAFRNACVHQGRPLDGGRLDNGVLVCPWHGFRYDAAAGECLSSPGSRLDAVACAVHGDRIWLRATNG
ncbi:MAG: Rieske (2Fe-2S) protein [Acidimicrobiales bacterium]